jgi:hypothetical protein
MDDRAKRSSAYSILRGRLGSGLYVERYILRRMNNEQKCANFT